MMPDQEVQGPTFQYSVKIDRSAKGARRTVHCYGKDLETAMEEAVKMYDEVGKRLEEKDLSVAPVEKGGKAEMKPKCTFCTATYILGALWKG